ncbi:MAG: EAL domain-containing protein [Nakamurella sp.]
MSTPYSELPGTVRTKVSLEELVTSTGSHLMGVTAATLHCATRQLLRELVGYFGVDTSFLRRNDHLAGNTVLVAEWPPRVDIPDPDPLGVIPFAGADRVFAATEHLSTVMIARPNGADEEYQETVRRGSGRPNVSLATVPLLDNSGTMGVLGFITFGDREWEPAEINALRAVAALLAQVQARVAAEEQLRSMAYHDELTGLANRRALIKHLNDRMAVVDALPVAVIFLDVDRLKAVNSFLGHVAGDQFLQELAARLSAAVGCNHLVARLGGDEFVVVIADGADAARSLAVASMIRRVAIQPIHVGGEEISRGISVGIAIGTPGAISVSALMGRADQAMLNAKSRGGNEIIVFNPEMRRHNEVRTDIELHLGSAIRNGSLVLHYQPEVDLATGNILGFEALVRWPHPTLGLLQPGEFIEVAEATNLAGELGRWVIEAGCQQLRAWHDRYPLRRLGLSVNVSPAQLITLDFAATVAETLSASGLDARFLTLEITEHALVRDTEQALTTLRELNKIGVRVALDDFGTGYSSFAQLNLPVNTLKIDRSFVQHLGESPNDLAIVRSIVGLAKAFNMELVAEGVESQCAADMLLALGCRRAQGYLFAKPYPADEVEWALEHATSWPCAR